LGAGLVWVQSLFGYRSCLGAGLVWVQVLFGRSPYLGAGLIWGQSLFGGSPYLGAVLIWAQALRPYELILNINAVHLIPSQRLGMNSRRLCLQ